MPTATGWIFLGRESKYHKFCRRLRFRNRPPGELSRQTNRGVTEPSRYYGDMESKCKEKVRAHDEKVRFACKIGTSAGRARARRRNRLGSGGRRQLSRPR